MGIENPVHLLFIAAIALVVLGPKRLPELARSLGKGIREFREAMSDGTAAGTAHTPAPGAPVTTHEPVLGGAVAADEPAPGGAVAVQAPAPGAPATPADAVVVVPTPESAPPPQVDPPEPVRSGDAPDSRPL